MSQELKPCPLCGAHAELYIDFMKHPDELYWVYCAGSVYGDCATTRVFHTEKEAVEAWNTRPIESALQARIAETETLMEKDHAR